MKTLHLVLKGKWYDMIESGGKEEEYREFNPYWCNRLIEKIDMEYWNLIFTNNSIEDLLGKGKYGKYDILHDYGYRHYDSVCFHRGYTNKTIMYQIKELKIGMGKEEWGASDKQVFIIKLGDKL